MLKVQNYKWSRNVDDKHAAASKILVITEQDRQRTVTMKNMMKRVRNKIISNMTGEEYAQIRRIEQNSIYCQHGDIVVFMHLRIN